MNCDRGFIDGFRLKKGGVHLGITQIIMYCEPLVSYDPNYSTPVYPDSTHIPPTTFVPTTTANDTLENSTISMSNSIHAFESNLYSFLFITSFLLLQICYSTD